jgi:hypothetical protein
MGTSDLMLVVGTLVSAAAGVLWVYVAVVTYRGQVNAQIFLDCNERYERIMESFPREAWEARLHMSTVLPEPSLELTLCVLKYLNLSSEEFQLYRRGYVHRDVWEIWEAELKRSLQSPLLRREWVTLRPEFEADPAFCRFVDAAQALSG